MCAPTPSNPIMRHMIGDERSPMRAVIAFYWRINPRHITCRQFNAFIVDYLDGGLTDAERRRFERHMRVCPLCQVFLERYEAARRAGRDLIEDDDDAPPPGDVPEDLIDAILASRDR